uniref:Uncharacterized protein n=1 Tax=Rhizophora mucronata TaxID=61149 RepID=A0A2P2JJE8_RHIMU
MLHNENQVALFGFMTQRTAFFFIMSILVHPPFHKI